MEASRQKAVTRWTAFLHLSAADLRLNSARLITTALELPDTWPPLTIWRADRAELPGKR